MIVAAVVGAANGVARVVSLCVLTKHVAKLFLLYKFQIYFANGDTPTKLAWNIPHLPFFSHKGAAFTGCIFVFEESH